MKRILLFCSTIFCATSFAQFDLSVHAGAGVGYISNSATVNMNHLYYGSPLRSLPKVSFEAGAAGWYYFDNTSISVGAAYFQVNAYQKEDTYGWGGEHIWVEKQRQIGYLSLPVMFHRDYDKVSFGGGLQPQFVVGLKEERRMWDGEFFNPPGDFEAASRTIRTFDLGLVGQINAKATKRLSVNFKVYWGMRNINNFSEKGAHFEYYGQENPVVDRKLRNKQFVITAQYKIFARKEDSSVKEKTQK